MVNAYCHVLEKLCSIALSSSMRQILLSTSAFVLLFSVRVSKILLFFFFALDENRNFYLNAFVDFDSEHTQEAECHCMLSCWIQCKSSSNVGTMGKRVRQTNALLREKNILSNSRYLIKDNDNDKKKRNEWEVQVIWPNHIRFGRLIQIFLLFHSSFLLPMTCHCLPDFARFECDRFSFQFGASITRCIVHLCKTHHSSQWMKLNTDKSE